MPCSPSRRTISTTISPGVVPGTSANVRRAALFAGGLEERQFGRPVGRPVEERVVLERANVLDTLDRWWRVGEQTTQPAMDGERLREGDSPGVADRRGATRSDADRGSVAVRSVDHSDRGRHAEERARVDCRVPEPGRGEYLRIDCSDRRVVEPGEPRKREPVRPGEHHRVALDDLEQSGEHGLRERRAARETVARRVADRRLGADMVKIDELRWEEGRLGRQRARIPRRTTAGSTV